MGRAAETPVGSQVEKRGQKMAKVKDLNDNSPRFCVRLLRAAPSFGQRGGRPVRPYLDLPPDVEQTET